MKAKEEARQLNSTWKRLKAKLQLCRDVLLCDQYVVVLETYKEKNAQRQFVRKVHAQNSFLVRLSSKMVSMIEAEELQSMAERGESRENKEVQAIFDQALRKYLGGN